MLRLRLLAAIFSMCVSVAAQSINLRGNVEVIHRSKERLRSGDVVVWLIPTDPVRSTVHAAPARLVQKDKRFTPHVLVIQAGSDIEFPNLDPFFHDVFSIYRGKPFDLGLYESGSSRKVKFSQAGVSYIFCNIHPEMSATIVAVSTPYFAVTSADGSFLINNLPAGHYKTKFWYELATETELASLSHSIEINASTTPFSATLHSSDIETKHLNKYGQEYSIEKQKSY
jgi:plastocyanin